MPQSKALRRGTRFEFHAPDGWQESQEGSRYIYRGPGGEGLIVSGIVAQGSGSDAERALLREELLDNASHAVRQAAAHPGLVTVKDFAREHGACEEECWTMVSETTDRLTLFCQAAAVADLGVLLVTLEAPKSVEAIDSFRHFLKSVRRVSGS